MRSDRSRRVQVGKLGIIELEIGYYLYAGSAFGPGGIKARVSRHLKKRKPKHWHLDYLSGALTPLEVWFTHDPVRREHDWAELLSDQKSVKPVNGFGCSDCHCEAHFFFRQSQPGVVDFRRRLTKKFPAHAEIFSNSAI